MAGFQVDDWDRQVGMKDYSKVLLPVQARSPAWQRDSVRKGGIFENRKKSITVKQQKEVNLKIKCK